MIMDERMKTPEDELLEHDPREATVLKHVLEMLNTMDKLAARDPRDRAAPPAGAVRTRNDTQRPPPHTLSKEVLSGSFRWA
jgi:hypothetical protein